MSIQIKHDPVICALLDMLGNTSSMSQNIADLTRLPTSQTSHLGSAFTSQQARNFHICYSELFNIDLSRCVLCYMSLCF